MQFLAIEAPAPRTSPSPPAQLAHFLNISLSIVACGQLAEIFANKLIQTLTHRSGDLARLLHEPFIDR